MPSDILTTEFNSVAQMQTKVGQLVGQSPWLLITQKMIDAFGRATGDEQWIHMDAERCKKESPYGTTIAHGFFVLSLIPQFLAETISFKNAKMGINYGSDKVRFMNAVPSGAKIRGHIELSEVEPLENGCKYKSKITVEIEGQEKPACVADLIAIIRF